MCMYMCIHLCVYIYIYIYTYIHTYMHTHYVYTCTHDHMILCHVILYAYIIVYYAMYRHLAGRGARSEVGAGVPGSSQRYFGF